MTELGPPLDAGVWPNYLVLLVVYALLIVAYRQWASLSDFSTPTVA